MNDSLANVEKKSIEIITTLLFGLLCILWGVVGLFFWIWVLSRASCVLIGVFFGAVVTDQQLGSRKRQIESAIDFYFLGFRSARAMFNEGLDHRPLEFRFGRFFAESSFALLFWGLPILLFAFRDRIISAATSVFTRESASVYIFFLVVTILVALTFVLGFRLLSQPLEEEKAKLEESLKNGKQEVEELKQTAEKLRGDNEVRKLQLDYVTIEYTKAREHLPQLQGDIERATTDIRALADQKRKLTSEVERLAEERQKRENELQRVKYERDKVVKIALERSPKG